MKPSFITKAGVFHWFHLENETRNRDLTTGILTITGDYGRHKVIVEIKNGLAKVMTDAGILVNLMERLEG